MAASESGNSGRVGFLSLLTILFIGLKLGGVIGWSWWWVLAPLWGGFALVVIIVRGVLAVGWLLERRA